MDMYLKKIPIKPIIFRLVNTTGDSWRCVEICGDLWRYEEIKEGI